MDKGTDLMPKQFPSLYQKIRFTFVILTSLIFFIFGGVIYVAEIQLEKISLEHRLTTETQQYMRNYQRFGMKAEKPDVAELVTYWSMEQIPQWLNSYQQIGFFEHILGEEDKHFLISHHPSGIGLLYVMYRDDADDYLDNYEDNLHLFTFTLGSILLLVVIAYGLYFVRLLSSPFSIIEDKIKNMPPDSPDFIVETKYRETRDIERTLLDNKASIAEFFTREKEFSQFASHELRTPIMIIQGSVDLLKKFPESPNYNHIAQKALARLDNVGQEMKRLVEAFLLLGKQDIESQHFNEVDLSTRLDLVLNELAQLFVKQESSYHLSISTCSSVYAPQSFIDIVIGNLIKNAFSYSVGKIDIELSGSILKVENYHTGNVLDNAGYGCGLVIVERICKRMGWYFSHGNNDYVFTVRVNFA
ncbi:sensor histidine kinase (plasmid) [Vibrio cyclitrophicus]|uniref:sensor histidine kinase n=2 Tax=Vibrio TaxID=662 RepID=UPI000C83AF06|nr:HAMP domain-containing sensor histidine kinase [Vibrio cyclitrophicus]PMJ49110.1 two-component sensor histidine kinase [Vibrio cyclitrophicus]